MSIFLYALVPDFFIIDLSHPSRCGKYSGMPIYSTVCSMRGYCIWKKNYLDSMQSTCYLIWCFFSGEKKIELVFLNRERILTFYERYVDGSEPSLIVQTNGSKIIGFNLGILQFWMIGLVHFLVYVYLGFNSC